jgi:hypothetical protein
MDNQVLMEKKVDQDHRYDMLTIFRELKLLYIQGVPKKVNPIEVTLLGHPVYMQLKPAFYWGHSTIRQISNCTFEKIIPKTLT